MSICWCFRWCLGNGWEDLLATQGWCGCWGLLPCYDNAGVDVALVNGCDDVWFMRWRFGDSGDDALVTRVCRPTSALLTRECLNGWRELFTRLWRAGWTIIAIPVDKEMAHELRFLWRHACRFLATELNYCQVRGIEHIVKSISQ